MKKICFEIYVMLICMGSAPITLAQQITLYGKPAPGEEEIIVIEKVTTQAKGEIGAGMSQIGGSIGGNIGGGASKEKTVIKRVIRKKKSQRTEILPQEANIFDVQSNRIQLERSRGNIEE